MENNVDLKTYNTFGLSCTAKDLFHVRNEQDLSELHELYCHRRVVVLGMGANTVFVDKNFDGVVARIENKGTKIVAQDDKSVLIEVCAGENWDEFVEFATQRGYCGVENLAGIPSSVGAVPVQNVGAYGAEVKDVIHSVCVFDLKTGKQFDRDNVSCKFAYRESVFKHQEGNLLIWKVRFKLSKVFVANLSYKALKDKVSQDNISDLSAKKIASVVRQIRESKLPDYKVLGNVGSFFRNPVVEGSVLEKIEKTYPDIVAFRDKDKYKLSAAYLIEHCGYKGKRIGNVGMHDKQALVMVNYGGATGEEILSLARQIQQSVYQTFGVDLQIEAHIIL